MSTGYYLLDNPNRHASASGDGPYRFHGYLKARENKRVIAIHTAENSPSVSSAEAIARYFATTDRAASYHTVFDSTGPVPLIPRDGVAYGIRNFNSPAIQFSAATRTIYWGKDKAWDDATIKHMAQSLARASRDFDIPIQRISAGAARNGAKGVVSHAEMDPTRRSDPGAKFPWNQFLSLAKGTTPEARVLKMGMQGGDVLDWQNDLKRWNGDSLPTYGADGDFGQETEDWTKKFQQAAGISVDGIVGSNTRKAMHETLNPEPDYSKHYDIAVFDTPSDAQEDKRSVAALAAAYYIHKCDPTHTDHHVGLLIVPGGPALRSIKNPQRFDRITELVGATRNDTWNKVFSWVADNPVTDLKAREAARQR